MNTLFSIVIPTFNEEKYIGTCLASIFNQKHNGLKQVIISDNGSTDKTLKIAKEFDVSIVQGSKPHNNGSARKLGFLQAKDLAKHYSNTEEILISTDADTVLSKGYLNTVYDNYHNNDSIEVSSGPWKTRLNHKIFSFGRWLQKINMGWESLRFGFWHVLKDTHNIGFLYGFNTVIRRSLYDRIGGFAEIRVGVDFDFTLKVISSKRKIYFLEKQQVETSSRKVVDEKGVLNLWKACKYHFQRDSMKIGYEKIKKWYQSRYLHKIISSDP